MLGGKQKNTRGYTIVEVMIVLAVSGVMFLIAAQFIQGKQEKSSFVAGVNSMASTVQDIIEQVTDGKFSDIQVNCTAGPTFSSGTKQQGSNDACLYLGKVLHFYGGSDLSAYEVFTIAGNRLVQPGNSQLVTNQPGINPLLQANPTPVTSPTDLTTQSSVPQHLDATIYTGSAGAAGGPIYAFGFLQSLGTNDGRGGVESGSQHVGLYDTPLSAGLSEPAAASNLKNNLTPAASVSLCLTDGTQTANIVIGSNNNQLSIDTKWEGNTATCS